MHFCVGAFITSSCVVIHQVCGCLIIVPQKLCGQTVTLQHNETMTGKESLSRTRRKCRQSSQVSLNANGRIIVVTPTVVCLNNCAENWIPFYKHLGGKPPLVGGVPPAPRGHAVKAGTASLWTGTGVNGGLFGLTLSRGLPRQMWQQHMTSLRLHASTDYKPSDIYQRGL